MSPQRTKRLALQEVIEHPRNTRARLEYATVLGRLGEVQQSALILVQCALGRLPDTDPRKIPLKQTEGRLLQEDRDALVSALPQERGISYEFHGGLVEQVIMEREQYRMHARKIFSNAPIQELTIRNQKADKGDFYCEMGRPILPILRSAYMQRLRGLRIEGYSAKNVFPPLNKHRMSLQNLRILGVGSAQASIFQLADLSERFMLPNVRTLEMQNNSVGLDFNENVPPMMELYERGIANVTRSFPRLQRWDLSNNVIRKDFARYLADNADLSEVEILQNAH